MKLSALDDLRTGDKIITTRINGMDVAAHCDAIWMLACEKVADEIAKRFLTDHAQELLAQIDQQAVANLAVADAAGAIREQLGKKLPDKILEVVRTEKEVYQRGIFGGMKRIR